jgi:hypothetical protein
MYDWIGNESLYFKERLFCIDDDLYIHSFLMYLVINLIVMANGLKCRYLTKNWTVFIVLTRMRVIQIQYVWKSNKHLSGKLYMTVFLDEQKHYLSVWRIPLTIAKKTLPELEQNPDVLQALHLLQQSLLDGGINLLKTVFYSEFSFSIIRISYLYFILL